MTRIIAACLLLLTFSSAFSLPPALAPTSTASGGVVNAILFWSNGCPFCEQALLEALPPVQERFGDQLHILLLELVTIEDINRFYQIGASLGLVKEQVNVPLMLVGNTALIGAEQISAELPGLVEQHLGAGGLDFPDLPGLADMLSNGLAFTSFDPIILDQSAPLAEPTTFSGKGLGWAVMVFMWVALLLVVVGVVRAFQGKPLAELKGWAGFATPLLALIGLGVALYLTYIEATLARAICGPIGDCNAVQSSPYARLFGVLPVGLLGALGYVAILVAWLWRRYRKDALAHLAGPALFGMALFGTLFSVYLTYLELFVILAVCIWCLSSAVIITLLMLLNLPPLTQWLAVSDEEEQAVD